MPNPFKVGDILTLDPEAEKNKTDPTPRGHLLDRVVVERIDGNWVCLIENGGDRKHRSLYWYRFKLWSEPKMIARAIAGKDYRDFITPGKEYEVEDTGHQQFDSGWAAFKAPFFRFHADNGRHITFPQSYFEVINQGKVTKPMKIQWKKAYAFFEEKTKEWEESVYGKKGDEAPLIADLNKMKRLEIIRAHGYNIADPIVKLFSSLDDINYGLYLENKNNAYVKSLAGAVFILTNSKKSGHAGALKVPYIASGNEGHYKAIDVMGNQFGYRVYADECKPATPKDIRCITEGQLERAMKDKYIDLSQPIKKAAKKAGKDEQKAEAAAVQA
jgi:hypothetical protein